MKKVVSLFKGIDIFGHQVGVNYRGEGTFNTATGSLVTLITALIVLSYASLKMIDIYTRDSQNELSNKIKINPEESGDIFLKENNFNFIFVLMHLRGPLKLPEDIGKIEGKMIK